MLLKVVRGVWIITCIVVLFVSLYYFSPDPKNDIGIFLIWSMLVLTFPSGFVVSAVFALIAFLLREFTDVMWDTTYLSISIVWLTFFAAGYLQWFVLVPKIVKWIKSKNHMRAA